MKSTITKPRFWFLTTIILVAAISRLFPHIPNFTPIAAMALFGGVYFNDRKFAFLVPLLAMFISDCFLEFISGWGFHNTIAYVYISIALITLIGTYVKRNVNVQTVLLGSVISSVLFFIITNFGVWAASGFKMGAMGLATTYTLGIPFFAPTLAGDIFFNGILFGSFYLAQRRIPALVRA
ncbi:MAG TPA: DUF6580 family putative transport protein [Bacteroidia bacterium]|nr:DUF6580 family putative transport protein [Bacteroidia bacterium]